MDVANAIHTVSYTIIMVLLSVVYHQALTLKALVALLYITVFLVICFKGITLLWTWHGHSFVV